MDDDIFADLLSGTSVAKPASSVASPAPVLKPIVEKRVDPGDAVYAKQLPSGPSLRNPASELHDNGASAAAGERISKQEMTEIVRAAVDEALEKTLFKFVKSLRTVLEDLSRRVDAQGEATGKLQSEIALISDRLESQSENAHARFTNIDLAIREVERGVQAMRDKQELHEAQATLAKLSAHKTEEPSTPSSSQTAAPQEAVPKSQPPAPVAVQAPTIPEPAPVQTAPQSAAPATPQYAAPATPQYAAPATPQYAGSAPVLAASQAPQAYYAAPGVAMQPLVPLQQQMLQPQSSAPGAPLAPPQHAAPAHPASMPGGGSPIAPPPPAPQPQAMAAPPQALPAESPTYHAPPAYGLQSQQSASGPVSGYAQYTQQGPPPPSSGPPYARPVPPPSNMALPPQGPTLGYAPPPPQQMPQAPPQPNYGAPPQGPNYGLPQPGYPVVPPSAPARTPFSRPGPPIAPPPQPSGQGDPGSRASTRSVPLEQIISDISNMGFERHQIMAVIDNLQKSGQSMDLNVILDRLTNNKY